MHEPSNLNINKFSQNLSNRISENLPKIISKIKDRVPELPIISNRSKSRRSGATSVAEVASADYETESVNCYLCGTDDAKDFMKAKDDYTGKEGEFSYVQCDTCDLVYQSPRLVVEDVKEFYDDDYVSHQQNLSFGKLTPLVEKAFETHDRNKAKFVLEHIDIDEQTSILDVGCARGRFLLYLQKKFGSQVSGVDFKDMSDFSDFDAISFYQGLFYEQNFGQKKFDVISMWHFLEHCYDPMRTLNTAKGLLNKKGKLFIEVPRLDSVTGKAFGKHWPGVQAPQHTMMFTKKTLLEMVEKSGLKVVEYRSWGTFPSYLYIYLGAIFRFNQGRGFDLKEHLPSYFAGQLAMAPTLALNKHLNLCMQSIVCEPMKD